MIIDNGVDAIAIKIELEPVGINRPHPSTETRKHLADPKRISIC